MKYGLRTAKHFISNLFSKPVKRDISSSASIYNSELTDDNGEKLDLTPFKGKKLLIVNTASECSYTIQYETLEKLFQQEKNGLSVIAIPANDFAKQEPLSDSGINSFCRVNFGVTFPVFK